MQENDSIGAIDVLIPTGEGMFKLPPDRLYEKGNW